MQDLKESLCSRVVVSRDEYICDLKHLEVKTAGEGNHQNLPIEKSRIKFLLALGVVKLKTFNFKDSNY